MSRRVTILKATCFLFDLSSHHFSDFRRVVRMKQRESSSHQNLPENLRKKRRSFQEKAPDVIESSTQDDPHPDELEKQQNEVNEYMHYAPEDVAPSEEANEKNFGQEEKKRTQLKEKRTSKIIQKSVLKPGKRPSSAEPPPPPPPLPPAPPASSAPGDEYEMLTNFTLEPPPVLAPPKNVAKIEEQDYYHGLLPREDVVALLRSSGDFLVRTTEMVSGSNRRFCVSVNWSGQHHFIVQTNKKGLFFLEDNAGPKNLEFPEVLDLINHYQKSHHDFSQYKVVLLNPVCRQSWQLRHDQVQLLKRLGEGAFGEVYSGVLTLTDAKKSKVNVAIKLMKCENFSKHQIEIMMKEARIMRSLSHPNIVRFYGVAVIQEPLLIVMELVTGGALHSYLRNNATKIPVNERMNMCLDAALGIDYVHRKGLVHRDIAARNCLYGNKSLKISDFGLSKKGKKVALITNEKAPVRSIAPEVFLTQTYTPAADVWAYGVLVWEIFMHGMEPYVGWTGLQIRDQILNHNYRLEFPWWTPPAFVTIMKELVFTDDPKARATCAAIARELERMTGRSPPRKSLVKFANRRSSGVCSAQDDADNGLSDPKISQQSSDSTNKLSKAKVKTLRSHGEKDDGDKPPKKSKHKSEGKLKKAKTERRVEDSPKTPNTKTSGSSEVLRKKKGQGKKNTDQEVKKIADKKISAASAKRHQSLKNRSSSQN
ncbi:hypothetical protein L596_018300 [Steinernema carpocapsae]|uniref:Tyrosine-protein kinase n=1 Tax=Steinernema carpocapsae TaxID=34508 RepID=A0A4U5N500_STECR|nr:hypothetical protein L596_018300 [Steinernema carpocapsae]